MLFCKEQSLNQFNLLTKSCKKNLFSTQDLSNNMTNYEGRPKSLKSSEFYEEISHGIKRAQEIMRQKGFEIGEIVAHPDDTTAYALKEVKGDKAVVWLPGQVDTIKEFPLNEIFNPNHAKEAALQRETKKLRRRPDMDN